MKIFYPLVFLGFLCLENNLVAQSHQPEFSSRITQKSAVFSKHLMIAVANPIAANVGYKILRQGGTAIDAAIAASMVLGLVEGQSSGIGGDAALLYWNGIKKELFAIDGRVKAPSNINEEMFYDNFGKKMDRDEAGFGGLAVGTPTLLRVLERAHQKFGFLPWKSLFEPAIKLAIKGFFVSPRLHKQIKKDKRIRENHAALKYFFDGDGYPRPVGYKLVNLPYAETLKRVGRMGAKGFYSGNLPNKIARAVKNSLKNPGYLNAADIRKYQPETVDPICSFYRGFKVCGMPPPSTGGLTIAMTLKMLERFDLKSLGFKKAQAHHLYIEAYRLAHEDRTRYIGDPSFYNIPVSGLLNAEYLRKRSQLIKPFKKSPVYSGHPPNFADRNLTGDNSMEPPSTTHLSIVDKYGNAISLTSSLGRGFGTGVMVDGFLLNSQLLGFGFNPMSQNRPNINRPEAKKRPRTSKSPTMVFNADRSLKLVIGSPGGGRIINYVARTIIAVIDWKLNIQDAISLPHVVPRRGRVELERGTAAIRLKNELDKRGHWVKTRSLTSGLHGIQIIPNGLIGGADTRREGIALGD